MEVVGDGDSGVVIEVRRWVAVVGRLPAEVVVVAGGRSNVWWSPEEGSKLQDRPSRVCGMFFEP